MTENMVRHRLPERMEVQFTVPMTRRTRSLLEAVATYQRTTVTRVIREAISGYLSRMGIADEQPPSLDDLVRAAQDALNSNEARQTPPLLKLDWETGEVIKIGESRENSNPE